MRLLDTHYAMETPEGIELELRAAGIMVRAVAWSIDLLLRCVIYFLVAYGLEHLYSVGIGLFSIFIFILEWFYPVLFEVYAQGATLGKQIMRIKVLHTNGTPVGWTASLIRNLLRAVDFLPFMYGFGLLSMLTTPQFQRLGDLSAGTIVVYNDDDSHQQLLSDIPLLEAEDISVILTAQEQRAIVHFAQRAAKLPPERAQELAEILTPLTGQDKPQTTVQLYRLANGLIGRHS